MKVEIKKEKNQLYLRSFRETREIKQKLVSY